MTYLVLSLGVLAALTAVTWRTVRSRARVLTLTGLALLALTVMFDNLIVAVGIVEYDEALILGVRMPIAPVEDLAYAVGAVLLVPALWQWLARLAPESSTPPEAGS